MYSSINVLVEHVLIIGVVRLCVMFVVCGVTHVWVGMSEMSKIIPLRGTCQYVHVWGVCMGTSVGLSYYLRVWNTNE